MFGKVTIVLHEVVMYNISRDTHKCVHTKECQMTQKNITIIETIAYGVTVEYSGKAKVPSYFVTAIKEDGSIEILKDLSGKSWQEVTAKSKERANDNAVPYWIADQTKAFQKRLVKDQNAN